jgi:hypothetical protein
VPTPTLSLAPPPLLTQPAATMAPTPEPVYQTRNGPRTERQMQLELALAGYAGSWDIGSVIGAYERATAPTLAPLPTPTPTAIPTIPPDLAGRCFTLAFEATLDLARSTSAILDFGAIQSGIERDCRRAALEYGSRGVSCWEYAVRQTFDMGARSSTPVPPEMLDYLYRGCLGV